MWIISDDETIDDTDDQMNGGNEVIEKANNKPVKRVENTIDYINIDGMVLLVFVFEECTQRIEKVLMYLSISYDLLRLQN